MCMHCETFQKNRVLRSDAFGPGQSGIAHRIKYCPMCGESLQPMTPTTDQIGQSLKACPHGSCLECYLNDDQDDCVNKLMSDAAETIEDQRQTITNLIATMGDMSSK